MNIQWPAHILAPRKITCEPTYATTSGGRSLTAVEQVVASDAGFWGISLDEIPWVSPTQKQVARALSVQLQGRLNPIDVPIYDQQSAPFPLVGGAALKPFWHLPHSDTAFFSDTSGYDGGSIVAKVQGLTFIGAVVIVINLVVGSSVQPGQHFSVRGASNQRLYRVQSILNVLGSVYTVQVWPPLRESISDGAVAEFNDPRLTCRLATDGEMKSFIDDYAGRTLAKVNFVELLP